MAPSLAVPLVLGLLCGGLVNFFSDGLPRERLFEKPRCPRCDNERNWADYVLLRTCRSCGHGRGLRSWIALAVSLGTSLFTWFQAPPMGYYLGMLLFGYFAVVTVIDLEHRLILGAASMFGGLLAMGLGWYVHGIGATLLGGLAGLVIMGGFYYLGVLFSRIRSRRLRSSGREVDAEEALGSGDVTLAVILGLLLGWPMIWFGLLLGVLLGGLFGLAIVIVELIRGHYAQRALMLFMPYGPAFILSACLITYAPKVVAGLLPQ